jgi:hypothetical protein
MFIRNVGNTTNLLCVKCFTLDDGTDRLKRNVAKYQSTPRKITEERKFI